MSNDTREDQGNYYPGGHVVVSGQGASGNPDLTALAATVYQHTGNGVVHVTASDKSAWTAKQDALTASQKAAVNSGITAAKVADIPANYVKDATATSTKLTLTKSDGTTVEYRGGGGSGGGAVDSVNGKTGEVVLTAADIEYESGTTVEDKFDSTTQSLGEHITSSDNPHHVTIQQIGAQAALASDGSDLPGGPYLQKSGGTIEAGPGSGGLNLSPSGFYIGGTSYDHDTATLTISNGSENGKIVVADGIEPASIKKGGKEVATEDQLPYASTSTPADRTCSTVTVASTGASVTIPKPSTDSKVTAFCVYLDMTALTGTAPTIGFKYSDNTDADILTRGGEGLSYETGAVNAVFFIQCGTKYIASAQVYK